MILAAALAFAWSAVGTATATILCGRRHRRSRSCVVGRDEFVKFWLVSMVWPLVWVGCGVEWLVGLRRGRSGLVVRVVSVDGDGDGLLSDGVGWERVAR